MKVRRLLAVALVLAAPAVSMAGFNIDEPVEPSAPTKVVDTGGPALLVEKSTEKVKQDKPVLTQSGAVLFKNYSSVGQRFSQGMGKDVQLGLAVSQIVQSSDWEIKSDNMVNMRKSVSWKGGAVWGETLEDVLLQAGYSAEIDGEAKTIMIYSRATPVENRVWELDPSDGSVRNALNKWVKLAGWQLNWDAPFDFPVGMYARLEGTLEDAISGVAQSLRTTENPVRVTLFEGNRVVRVTPADGGKRR
jgi:hypothetical protein